MIKKVISGGQTGADQAGWRAATQFGIPTGGWMPKGFLTEDGPRPAFAAAYGAREHESLQYPPRTHANAREAETTLWFGGNDSRGFGCTASACRKAGRPIWVVADDRSPRDIATLLRSFGYTSLNIAGTRESKSPGIGVWVEDFLAEVFRLLGHQEVGER